MHQHVADSHAVREAQARLTELRHVCPLRVVNWDPPVGVDVLQQFSVTFQVYTYVSKVRVGLRSQ
jgi:hypothetical protein